MKTGQISDIVSLELSTFVKTRKKEGIAVGKQILIVEDNELNRAMLCEILSEEYQVLEAENGQEALEILRIHGDTVALILLDVMMPVMDGYAFLDLVRQDPQLSLIPVIVTTQSGSEEDEVAALSHGATDFVPKPYRPQVILHRVASLIKLRETAAMVNQFQFDRLTGLYSREFFYRKVRERLEENPNRDYAIICSNIENFKLYNDVYGAQNGDRLLQEVSRKLRESVGPQGICGRYGADRFLCLQEREQEEKDRERFFGTDSARSVEMASNVTTKWGIYAIVDRSLPVEQMCDRAVLAVDSIKGQYNRGYAVYDDTMRSRLLREQAVTAAMETALEQRQFIVYLQPKYSLRGDRMAGAEALVRWIHPEWGFMNPGEFIPLFERNGFITKLDLYVWERVCMLLRDWRAAGLPVVPVSVNVSRADVYQADLIGTLTGLTEKYGIRPSLLHLEITESAYTEHPEQLISTVTALREKGFVIEMDDFGSGYSSLNMLTEMSLDILKLDMKFVRNETSKPETESILRHIVELAHWKKLSVVAEGTETREQIDRLRAVGCDYAQGYFFAKPMPDTEFASLLKALPAPAKEEAGTRQERRRSAPVMLVAEENDAYRATVRDCLQTGYEVLEAEDAASAVEQLHRQPSVVVLSMSLPGHGALEVLKVMRQNPSYWKIPVLSTIPQCDVGDDLPLAVDTDDFLCKCHPISDLRRRVDNLVQMASLRRHEDALQDEASRDYLTGLLNRRGLAAAQEHLRREDLPLAVFLFDLDDLKMANDTAGHEAGDRMIRTFAELLRRKTRAGDILCRYGGDEFVVMLRLMGKEEDAVRRAESICREFRDQLAAEGLTASCSVGIAMCGVEDKPDDSLIDRADQAMYRAKQQRKGTCCVWHEETATTDGRTEDSPTV